MAFRCRTRGNLQENLWITVCGGAVIRACLIAAGSDRALREIPLRAKEAHGRHAVRLLVRLPVQPPTPFDLLGKEAR
jgi:hypothetical protein